MIYLASPYSSPDFAVREARFQAACCATAALIQRGVVVFSPIVHSHPLIKYGLPIEWAEWASYDREFLSLCSELWVLTIDGWRESKGVQAEIAIAREQGKPVVYHDAFGGVTAHGE